MTNLFLFVLYLICQVNSSYAQDNKAIITYRGEVNQKYVDSFLYALENDKTVSMEVKQGVADMYYNAKPEYFELKVTNHIIIHYLS